MGRRTDEDFPKSRREILEQADCDHVVLSIIAFPSLLRSFSSLCCFLLRRGREY
jgi:hypothetical protein